MKIKFIAPLLLIPFFLGCATTMLSDNIRMDDSPLREIKQQKYSGTIMYDPSTNTYYTNQLLIGKDRKVAISFFRKYSDFDAFKIKEITDFPQIPLKEVPLRIEPDYIKPEASDLLNNGIVIHDTGNSYGFIKICVSLNDKTTCYMGDLEVRRITKNFFIHNLKKLGYLITVPIDIVTHPLQILCVILMQKE